MDLTVNIEYIGRREPFIDPLFSTGAWEKGEVKAVPAALAPRMTRYPDVFKVAESQTEKAPAAGNPKADTSTDENLALEELKAQIGAMNKEGLITFAKDHYGQVLHPNIGEDKARAKVIALVDQYGAQ